MVMPNPLTKIDAFIKQVDGSINKDLYKTLQHLKKTFKKVSQTTTSEWITR